MIKMIKNKEFLDWMLDTYPTLSIKTLPQLIINELAKQWFREVHKIHICVDISLMSEWYVSVYHIKYKPSEFNQTYEILDKKRFKTYNEALTEGLKESCKVVINERNKTKESFKKS